MNFKQRLNLTRCRQRLGTRTGIRVLGGLFAIAAYLLFDYGLFAVDYGSFDVVYHRDFAALDFRGVLHDSEFAPLVLDGWSPQSRPIKIIGYVALFVSIVALIVPESVLFFATTMLVVASALIAATVAFGAQTYGIMQPHPWTVTPLCMVATALCGVICFGSVLTLRSIWLSRARPREYAGAF